MFRFFRHVGNRYHFYEGPATNPPYLHIHALTGGFASPISAKITPEQARAATSMLDAHGASSTAALARAWWSRHGVQGNNTFRRNA